MTDQNMSYANFANLPNLDQWYEAYQQDPSSVGESLASFFQGFDLGKQAGGVAEEEGGDVRLFQLIDAYRRFGHLAISCNPLKTAPLAEPTCLKLSSFGFKEEELSSIVNSYGIVNQPRCTLKELIDALKKRYCSQIGFEYMHIENQEMRKWIEQAIEHPTVPECSKEEKLLILQHLTQAELLETFLHTKYTGQKRFSLEGCETLIPLLCALIEEGAPLGLKEVVIGASHRGRLNLLTNILGKSYHDVFYEFEDHYIPMNDGSGDVKYHKGFVGTFTLPSQEKISISLAPNASHLDSADPISLGICRAKQETVQDKRSILPIIINGDAAMTGQGVIYETMELCALPGYGTQGTIHVIINNQIGFTTAPEEGRSTRYCSDLGKAFDCPIFHINAENPLSCVFAAKMAIAIRQKFGVDVFIDLNGYRKYGHNEGDEPFFTQPLEYALIRSKETIYQLFCKELVRDQVLSQEEISEQAIRFKELLQEHLKNIPPASEKPHCFPTTPPSPHMKTAVEKEVLLKLANAFCSVPATFKIHPKVAKLLQDRLKGIEQTIDWGMGEHLAFASLLAAKIPVRLSGQDSGRGTFSHRHALLVDQVTGEPYIPLNHVSSDQAPFYLYNSPLSEYGVLGFEFGYSSAAPSSLVMWEAQFGDFCNTAQVIIDQYIAASEKKWNFTSSVTLLLPHGYDGQGPDHSNGRLERFLQLAAQNNMRIVYPSTPAQLFHILREQALVPMKKPLILFTPKALLRHHACISPLSAFTEGCFEEVILDPTPIEKVSSLILCTGRVYYDLIQERKKRNNESVAIVRIEQLYPFPEKSLVEALKAYRHIKKILWVQEEPHNMGAWSYISPRISSLLGSCDILRFVGREESAASATGSHALHDQQLSQFLTQAFE